MDTTLDGNKRALSNFLETELELLLYVLMESVHIWLKHLTMVFTQQQKS